MRGLAFGLSLVLGVSSGAVAADYDRFATRHCGTRALAGSILNPLSCRVGRRPSAGMDDERQRSQREALARQDLHERILRLHQEIGLGPAVITADEVSRAQRLLTALGYYRGPLDGVHGAQTRSGVMQFEVSQGLPRTGLVTPSILQRMKAAL